MNRKKNKNCTINIKSITMINCFCFFLPKFQISSPELEFLPRQHLDHIKKLPASLLLISLSLDLVQGWLVN